MSASRVITVSPPGRSSLASIAISRSVLWIHSTSGELHASTAITLGSRVDQPIGGRMIESNHAADDRRRRASPTVAQDFVPVAHLFAWQVEELRGSHSRLARQPVAGTVRHEREIAGLQDVILAALHVKDAPT